MNVTRHFHEAAANHPGLVAIIDGWRRVTYTELQQGVYGRAAYFQSMGIAKGDRVFTFIPMGIELYESVLALMHIGATPVFVDAWVNLDRLSLSAQLADCNGIIGGTKVRLLRMALRELRKIPVFLSLSKKGQGEIELAEVDESDSALITFTTGSTGIPKAADRSHRFLNAQFEALKLEINPQPGDIDLITLPIVLFVNLGVGATSVIPTFKLSKPDTLKAEKEYHWLVKNKVKRVISSPFYMLKIADFLKKVRRADLQLREVFTGGAPVYPDEAAQLISCLPKARVNIVYGSTEAEPISIISAHELVNSTVVNGLNVGTPNKAISIRILEIGQYNPVDVVPGQVGEITVSGAHVLDRYFRNEEAFRKNKFEQAGRLWHRTGDSGFLHDGKLYLTGQADKLINRGGWIAPLLVEAELRSFGISKSTALEIENQLILVIESDSISPEVATWAEEKRFNRVLVHTCIPRDLRHRSKIDYGKLEKWVCLRI